MQPIIIILFLYNYWQHIFHLRKYNILLSKLTQWGQSMKKEKSSIYNIICIMDVVSMLMILFYHCACYQEIFTGKLSSELYLLISLFVTFGLTCFTFSSGFKLAINHHSDIKNNDFLCKYIAKRTLSLAKIYFFYPLICLIIYGILFLFNLSKLAQPYISSIGSINYDSFFN